MQRILDGLIYLLFALIVAMWLTGGVIVRFSKAKIEFSQLDAWILGLIVLVLIRKIFFSSKPFHFLSFIKGLIEKASKPHNSVWLAKILFIWIFLGLYIGHVFKHWSFRTFSFDLCFLHQPLFYPFGEIALKCDLCFKGSYLVEHLAYTLYLFTPLTVFFRSDLFIFAIQVLSIAVPIWLFLTKGPLERKKELWFFTLFILVSCTSLRQSLIWDLREDHFGFGFLILSFLYLFRKRLFLFSLFLLLSVMSKENFGLITLFAFIPIFFDKTLPLDQGERFKFSAVSFLISLVWVCFAFGVLIPYVTEGNESRNNIVLRFPEFGKTTSEVILNFLTSPKKVIELFSDRFLRMEVFKYIIVLLVPFLFFLRKNWYWMIPVIPAITMNVLSTANTQVSFEFHYQLVILPFLIMGTILGIRSDRSKINWLLPLVLALLFSGRWPGQAITEYWPDKKNIQTAYYIKGLLPGLAVASSHWGLAHLSHHRTIVHLRFPETSVPENETLAWNMIEDINWKNTPIDRILVDLLEEERYRPWAEFLVNTAPKRGWKLHSKSPNDRFVFLIKDGLGNF